MKEISRLMEEKKKHYKQRQSEIDAAVAQTKHKANQQIHGYEIDLQDLANKLASLRGDQLIYVSFLIFLIVHLFS